MPELPDIELYVHALRERVLGANLVEVRIANPFLLRSVDPGLDAFAGRTTDDVQRIGKRIAFGFADDYWLVLHLMIAGRLQWQESRPSLGSRNRIAAFDFDSGSVLLTEAGSKKRASLYAVHGADALEEHNPGGLEPLLCTQKAFLEQLLADNRTVKRALTDPRRFSGIGNAYSDEILHRAKLSPAALTGRLSAEQQQTLFQATQKTLEHWRRQLLAEAGDGFPKKVTAFKDAMAVHGRFGKPCPECGSPVQRIRYKSRETNYCAQCQTDGRLLSDRSLARLLKDDWQKTLDRE